MSESSASTGPRQIDRKKKLGKGLGALLGETRREEPLVRSDSGQNQSDGQAQSSATTAEPAANGLTSIPVANIEPLPGQPRTHFDEESLDSLASSIATRGVIQPIIVSPLGKGRYRLVAGERRWRAAQRARLHEIPALVRDLDQREVMALALIENLQREDLNPVEEARAYQKLSEDDGMTQAEIAKLVDKSRSHDIAAVQGHLEEFLGMPVKITTDTTPNSGAVTIRFRTLDQLDLICQRLTGGDI